MVHMETTDDGKKQDQLRLVQQLTKLLDAEARLHSEHSEILAIERQAVTAQKALDVASCAAQREDLIEKLSAKAKERESLMKELGVPAGQKLTEWVQHNLSSVEAKPVLEAIKNLKTVVNASRREVTIFGHLTQFALNMVNGALSILWSANQNEVKSYSPQGKLQKSYQPATTRQAGVLKKA
jgi:hypothetical protein